MNDFQRKWLDALRSGKYEQGQGVLRSCKTGKPRYCCLGVACELKGMAWDDERGYAWHVSTAPQEVESALCLRDSKGISNRIDLDQLTILNDNGKTFTEIADIIESDPGAYFTNCEGGDA